MDDSTTTTTSTNAVISVNTTTTKEAPEKYCHCNRQTNAESMIECTNGTNCVLFNLTKGWYHVSCVGLKNTRAMKNENWLCPTCATIAKPKK